MILLAQPSPYVNIQKHLRNKTEKDLHSTAHVQQKHVMWV